MLGARTKLVNSYGKRKNRIVAASDGPKAAINIFEDMEVVEIKPLVSRMKKRENCTPKRPKMGSPRRVHVSKNKLLSPPVRRIWASQPIEEPVGKKLTDDVVETTPPRAPLAPFSLNVPSSPMAPGKQVIKKRHHISQKSTTPLTESESHKPVLTVPKKDALAEPKLAKRMKRRQTSSAKDEVQVVDIVVIDADGTPVKQERRFSRKTVSVPILRKGDRDVEVTSMASADSEAPPQTQQPRMRTAKRVVVISDSEDSEVEEVTPPPKLQAKKSISRSGSSGPKGLLLEVVIPPAPYPTSSSLKSLSQQQPISKPPSEPPSSSTVVLEVEAKPFPLLGNPRFNHISSPVAKPRQLTPIRRGAGKAPFPNRPSSPAYGSSPLDDLSITDLSLELEELNLNTSSEFETSSFSAQPEQDIPEYLKPLLAECHQSACGPVDFSSFIETFPFDPVISSESGKRPKGLSFRKIGEASYSEVFGIGDVVLKVIPLRDESPPKAGQAPVEEDGPAESDAKDVLREIIVTRAMGNVCDGFVELLKTYVVKGKYPEVLLRLWDEYHEARGSESVRPDTFLVSQTYAIVVLPNGGPDLETYKFVNASKNGWKQASSLFWQVAKTLAKAERLVSFEHRDLHWGQILVRSSPSPAAASPLFSRDMNLPNAASSGSRIPMDDTSHGVRATLIDLGLARMDAGDGGGGEMVHWTKFDEEIFMGEGDYQFDLYRMMRHHVSDRWEDFRPLTNVMWLHYLALKLLNSKGLKPPTNKISTYKSSPNTFSEKECYDSLMDIEAWLRERVTLASPPQAKPTKKPRGRPRKTALPAPAAQEVTSKDPQNAVPSCAGEVVAYAIKRGWVEESSM